MTSSALLPAFRLPALLLSLLTLGACTGLMPKLEPPQLALSGVELVKGDLLRQQFRVRMRVTNPNDRVIAVRSVSYTLELGGEELGRGLSGSAFDIPARGEAEFDMTVTADIAGTLLRLLDRARGSGMPDTLEYRLRGQVKLAHGFARDIPFDETGSLSLR